jgi:nitric oxide reductase large subunit
MNITIPDKAINAIAALLISIGSIAGFGWLVAKPLAEDFIHRTIAENEYAKQQQVDNLRGKALRTEQTVRRIEQNQTKTQAEIEIIKELAKEQRDLSRQLLQKLPGQ